MQGAAATASLWLGGFSFDAQAENARCCRIDASSFRLPVPMVWQVNSDTLSRRQYLKDIDYLREHTRADILLLAPVEGVMPEDTDQFHAPVECFDAL